MFGIVFVGTYTAIDKTHQFLNPDYDLEELHAYITQVLAQRTSILNLPKQLFRMKMQYDGHI